MAKNKRTREAAGTSKKQWQIIYWSQWLVFIVAFVFCLIKGLEKVAWFVVFPLALATSIILRRQRKSK